jgi:hypothetical protein
MTDIDIELHNPEDDARRRAFKLHEINAIAISSVLLIGTLFMAFGKRPTISEEEKRELAKCPTFSVESYLDGSFTSQFSQFYNDSVPMRSTFKHIIATFRGHLGIDFEEVEIHGQIPVPEQKPAETVPPPTEAATERPTDATGAQPAETAAETAAPTEATTEAEPDDQAVDGEVANNILIVKDRGVMLYGGGYAIGEQYANTLNLYKEKLGEDVNVYSLVAPTACSFYLPDKFKDMSASEIDNIDHINSLFKGVKPVDAYSALLAHKDEDIYSRTDHHWAPLGAFYAAEAFAKTAEVPFAPLRNYNAISKEGYVGTLYGFSGSSKLKDNPETFTYYEPKGRYTCTYYNTDMTNEREKPLLISLDNLDPASWYLVFMGGDERITHITTECMNHRTLCIIKDSYGNALVPALTSSFEEIWVVDMRYFKPNIIRFMQEHEVTDVLFAMNTFSATGSNAKHLQTLLNQ